MLELHKTYTVAIEDMSFEGDGIGRADGIAVFVPGTIPGDVAEVRISLIKKNYAHGAVVEIIEPSKERINPPCSYAEQCGGCSLQAMVYDAQLKLKQKMVRDALTRIGKLEDPKVRHTMGMRNPFGYRNKAQFPVTADGVGFFKVKSHEVVNCEHCIIQTAAADMAAAVLRRYIESDRLMAYNEKTGEGLLRHLIVRTAFNTGEVMIILVINGTKIPNRDKFISMMVKGVPGVKSIVLNVNRKRPPIIMGRENITIYGEDRIVDTIDKLKFEISPQSFYQVNPVQMKRLYNVVVEYGALQGKETVLDLYSGVGTIGLYCAAKARKVIGIESEKAAVDDAVRNAEINNIKNAEFICGKAEIELPKLASQDIKPDVVILDPPRTGCDAALLATVSEIAPARIVYVSCNPSTLARDVRILCDSGYDFVEAQPVDMFPQTTHVEAVALMSRVGK